MQVIDDSTIKILQYIRQITNDGRDEILRVEMCRKLVEAGFAKSRGQASSKVAGYVQRRYLISERKNRNTWALKLSDFGRQESEKQLREAPIKRTFTDKITVTFDPEEITLVYELLRRFDECRSLSKSICTLENRMLARGINKAIREADKEE